MLDICFSVILPMCSSGLSKTKCSLLLRLDNRFLSHFTKVLMRTEQSKVLSTARIGQYVILLSCTSQRCPVLHGIPAPESGMDNGSFSGLVDWPQWYIPLHHRKSSDGILTYMKSICSISVTFHSSPLLSCEIIEYLELVQCATNIT